MFGWEPEPHVFFGSDIADLTKDIQRVKSAVLRGILDSLAFALYPRTGVVEGMVEIVLDGEVLATMPLADAPPLASIVLVGESAMPALGGL